MTQNFKAKHLLAFPLIKALHPTTFKVMAQIEALLQRKSVQIILRYDPAKFSRNESIIFSRQSIISIQPVALISVM